MSLIISSIPATKVNSEPRRAVLKALEAVGAQKMAEGSRQLNVALQLDPSNSYLQLLNAFVYHLQAQQGDTSRYALAEQGYLLAVKFDASNWVAHYLLGMLYFEQRNFAGAQREMAEVLLSVGEDAEVLLRLVAAAYYAGDPVTAAVALERLRATGPQEPETLRLSALISAAINQPDRAAHWLTLYEATSPGAAVLQRAKDRVRQWAAVHRPQVVEAGAMLRTQAPFVPGAQPADSRWPSGMPNTGYQTTPDTRLSGPGDPNAKRMVLVDVVIIRAQDELSTRKGVNLLSALTLQFGSAGGPAYGKTSSVSISEAGFNTSSTAVTRAITIPALAYSLNIVNASANVTDVLAQPTLAALEGVPSEFFSGTLLNAAVVSGSALGGSSVQLEKEIGVKLRILPTFLPDNKIRLNVEAQRTFLQPPSQDVSFTYKLEMSKLMVNANVVMEFGETLVLGGLSEKETINARDGVPVLQDVPVLQYLFSSRNENSFRRSVLLLITPRPPQYTYRSDAALAAEAAAGGAGRAGNSMQELRARYGDWFKPYNNLAPVFNLLNQSSLYREFRTGDVTLEKWDRQERLLDRLRQALGFLFF
jgi:Tfp pilus assembly protein PilF